VEIVSAREKKGVGKKPPGLRDIVGKRSRDLTYKKEKKKGKGGAVEAVTKKPTTMGGVKDKRRGLERRKVLGLASLSLRSHCTMLEGKGRASPDEEGENQKTSD